MKPRSSYRLFLCLPFLLATRLLLAAPVDVDTANRVALAKLAELPGSTGFSIEEIVIQEDELLRLYICRTTPQGYLVVSGDTELPPVVAFSLGNDFGEMAINSNPLLSLLVADLQTRLDNLELLTVTTRSERQRRWEELLADTPDGRDDRTEWWPPQGSTPTGGWIETNWTQNYPYNSFCPIDLPSGQRCVAGCPSIAMAQILNYHRTVRATRFSDLDDYYHNYAGNSFWIDDDYEEYDFPSFPDLNIHLDSLVAQWEGELPLTNDHKAALVFASGVACKQVYNPAGSGTFGVIQAYNAWLRFNFPEIRLLDEDDADLYPSLAQNMMDALPVHFAVVTPQWDMGHNVVLDGYNSDDYYHMNFGWGGPYNGWYLLPDEIPYGLTVVEGAICDIGFSPTSAPETAATVEMFELLSSPNPCNPSTHISFNLTAAADITLSVFDVQGRLVQKLVDGPLTMGQHSVQWEPQVASGVFFVRLSCGADNGFAVTKVTVLK